MAVALDTLAAMRRMEDAGMEREHAEAVAEAVREAASSASAAAVADRDRMATKADLSALEARLTWRIVGFVIAANALLVAAVKLIP